MTEPTTILHSLGYLLKHAQTRPTDVVVIDNDRSISYGVFLLDVCRMRRAISTYNVKAGSYIAVNSSQFYLQWVVLLACESLEIPTLSFASDEIEILKDLLDDAGLVMCNPDFAGSQFNYDVLMDKDWFRAVRKMDPDLNMSLTHSSSDVGLRIIKSSGTTGSLKAMMLSAKVYKHRLKQALQHSNFTRDSICFLSLEFTVQSMHDMATACLREGGKIVVAHHDDFKTVIPKEKVTHVSFLPLTLKGFLEGLNGQSLSKVESLTVLSGGATIKPAIRQAAIDSMGANFNERYGANEVGYVCKVNPDGIATALPGEQMQVIDDDFNPVFDEVGVIRICSNGSVGAYIDDVSASNQNFKDGWFYPGDRGVMFQDGTVKLCGRVDALLNVGGVKFNPASLEQQISGLEHVADACVLQFDDEPEDMDAHIFVVLKEENLHRQVFAQIKPVLPAILGKTKFHFVKNIPRTSTGKVQRYKLEGK